MCLETFDPTPNLLKKSWISICDASLIFLQQVQQKNCQEQHVIAGVVKVFGTLKSSMKQTHHYIISFRVSPRWIYLPDITFTVFFRTNVVTPQCLSSEGLGLVQCCPCWRRGMPQRSWGRNNHLIATRISSMMS